MIKKINRRHFLKTTGALSLSLSVTSASNLSRIAGINDGKTKMNSMEVDETKLS